MTLPLPGCCRVTTYVFLFCPFQFSFSSLSCHPSSISAPGATATPILTLIDLHSMYSNTNTHEHQGTNTHTHTHTHRCHIHTIMHAPTHTRPPHRHSIAHTRKHIHIHTPTRTTNVHTHSAHTISYASLAPQQGEYLKLVA
jgi:hypothetical protein